MRYAVARIKTEKRLEACRIYVTDGLYVLSNGLHSLVGGGLVLTTRFAEVISPVPAAAPDNRTQEEIVAQVWRGIRGENKK